MVCSDARFDVSFRTAYHNTPTFPCNIIQLLQGQLLEGVECHIYLYCFTFDDINLNRAFVIIVLFPKKYSNKKVCANDMRKKNALGIY